MLGRKSKGGSVKVKVDHSSFRFRRNTVMELGA